MTSMLETHPPVRTMATVRTGASKVEITSPAKCRDWISADSTYGKRSRQFGIAPYLLSLGKRRISNELVQTISLLESQSP